LPTADGEPDLDEAQAAASRGLSERRARQWMKLTNRNLGGLTPAEAVTAGKGER